MRGTRSRRQGRLTRARTGLSGATLTIRRGNCRILGANRGRYKVSLLACSQRAHKEERWLNVTSTEKLKGVWIMSYVLSHSYLTAIVDSTWCKTRRPTYRSLPLGIVDYIPNLYFDYQMRCEGAVKK